MLRESVTIQIANGLETRPIAMLVQVASQYRCSVHLESGTRRVNAKSIMGMMTLGLDNGESVTVVTEGEDEAEALQGLTDYLTQNRK